MAGHVVASYFHKSSLYEVSTVSAHNKFNDATELIDITNAAKFNAYLDNNEFDVIINCVGVLVKASEQRKDLAVYLNSYLPHMLEHRYADTGTKLIHLSTDCVFSGEDAPYTETAWPDGTLFYDRSKALGEINNQKDLTFRMSIIGPDSQEAGIGLFNWFFAQTGRINGYTAAIWNGITTITLAKAIEAAIEQNLTGLYHLVPKGNISKFNLLQLFTEVFRRDDITVAPTDGVSVNKTLVNTRTDFNFTVPAYPQMIHEMKQWIDENAELYPHYHKGEQA